MNVKFYAAALMALALAGCNNDEMDNPLADGPVPMSFTADINSVATRATTTGFQDGDVVGIIPLKGTEVEKAQANIAYTYNNEGKFTANPPYYFQNYDYVTFNAYYPYQTTFSEEPAPPYEIAINTRQENQTTESINGHNWRKNDFLFTSAETYVKEPFVSFTGDKAFKHVMSSVAIDFKAGKEDGVANLQPLEGYTLGNLVMDGTFNCSTGALSFKSDAKAEPITVEGISCGAVEGYQTTPLILLPQKAEGGVLNLTVNFNETTYTAELSLVELQAGKLHVFPVTIKNTGLEIREATIKDWETTIETGGGEATLQ